MKQASEKAGVSWSPELGDSSQVLGGGAGGANMWDCTPKGSKNFVSLSKSPGLCGWFLGGRAPPHPVTHLWPLGLLQFPGGGKRAALRGSLPVPPPFLQHTPSPPPSSFCPPAPPSPGSRLGRSEVSSPLGSRGGSAGAFSTPSSKAPRSQANPPASRPQRVPSAACQPLSVGPDPRRRRGWGSC